MEGKEKRNILASMKLEAKSLQLLYYLQNRYTKNKSAEKISTLLFECLAKSTEKTKYKYSLT